MIPDNRIPTHPGVILSQEFLAPLGITQVALTAHLGVPVHASTSSCAEGAASLPNRVAAGPGAQHHAGVLDQPPGGPRPGAQPTSSDGPAPECGQSRSGVTSSLEQTGRHCMFGCAGSSAGGSGTKARRTRR